MMHNFSHNRAQALISSPKRPSLYVCKAIACDFILMSMLVGARLMHVEVSRTDPSEMSRFQQCTSLLLEL